VVLAIPAADIPPRDVSAGRPRKAGARWEPQDGKYTTTAATRIIGARAWTAERNANPMNRFLKLISLAVLLGPLLATAAGDSAVSPALKPDAPSSYVVQKGDTLWGVAGKFLREPWFWPEIWYVNPEIKNPHRIYPGDTLKLVYVGANGAVVAAADLTGGEHAQVRVERGNTVHLTPQVRSESVEQAIPAVPYEIVAAFMGKPSVIPKDDVATLPYIVALREGHVIAGMGDEVYARGILGADPGAHYNVVQIGDKVKDPDDGALLGYMGIYAGGARVVGTGSIDRQETELTKLTMSESARETLEGDRLIRDHLEVALDFVPHAPNKQIDARIVAIVDGVTVIGQYEVVALNRGTQHGLEPGHVLIAWQSGEVTADKQGVNPGARREFENPFPHHVRLPDERAGTLMVFRTYERMSFALVLAADAALRINDAVRNP
jgi:hypothetical protein